MEFIITYGTLLLVLIGFLFLLLVRGVCCHGIISSDIRLIDKLVVIALFLRIVWACFVCYLSNFGYAYFVYDDEGYSLFASGIINENSLQGVNGYYYFLRFMYVVFGRTTLTGRAINLFFSVAVLYPLAILEKLLCGEKRYYSTKFFACSPFMIFISFFEIKDIIVMFLFVSSYVLVKFLQDRFNLWALIFLFVFCASNETFRSGSGVLPIVVLALNAPKLLNVNRNVKWLLHIMSISFLVVVGVYVGRDYILQQADRVDGYQNWIVTQFASSSIYSSLVVTSMADIWKFPFCFLLYALQPVNIYQGSMRYFTEYGLYAKFVDAPILFFSILLLPIYIKKEKWDSLLFVFMYSFTACINLTNARQGFFLYPIMYLIFFDGLATLASLERKNRFAKMCCNRVIGKMFIAASYILWFAFVLHRT